MGMEQTVAFEAVNVPAWDAVGVLLFGLGYSVQVRMIDGQLSLPDEQPPDDWRELRVGTPQGMVTLRRAGDRITRAARTGRIGDGKIFVLDMAWPEPLEF